MGMNTFIRHCMWGVNTFSRHCMWGINTFSRHCNKDLFTTSMPAKILPLIKKFFNTASCVHKELLLVC